MSAKSKSATRAAAGTSATPVAEDLCFASDRGCMYVNLGSLGSSNAAILAAHHPRVKNQLLAIDTARPPASGEGPVEPPEWQIFLSNPDIKSIARSRRLALLNDGLIPRLEYPQAVTNGAAEVRLFAMIKFAEALSEVRRRLRHLISTVLDDANGRPLHVIVTSSVCGGTGSALIIPAIFLIRDEARRISPGAAVDVSVLGVLPAFFLASSEVQQTDRERLRLEANTAATLREIKYLQTPANSYPLQKALGINPRNPIDIPVITALYLYGSEAGGGTITPAKLTDRLVAAALTLPAVAEIEKNLGNAAGQYWGAFGRPEHAIIAAAADRSVWLPPAIRDLYVESLLADGLAAAVRKPEAEHTDGLMKNFKARLGLGGIEGGIQQALDELAPAEKVTVDPQIGRLSNHEATAHLIGIHQYFKAEVMQRFLAKARSKARELELVVVPQATGQCL